jgi:hypothetical protein
MLPAGGPHMWQPFASHQQGWTDALLPRKSAPDSTSQPGWVVHGTRLSFSPNTTIEAVCLSQAPIGGRLLGLPGPYHRHAIGTFNTCSRVPTPRSWTDTGWGYHIDNFGIAIALSPPFPSEGSTDPLMACFSPNTAIASLRLWIGSPSLFVLDPCLICLNSACISFTDNQVYSMVCVYHRVIPWWFHNLLLFCSIGARVSLNSSEYPT